MLVHTLKTIFAALLGLLGRLPVAGALKSPKKRGRTFAYNPDVAKWGTWSRLTESKLPVPVMLAIVQVESEGDPTAHRVGSQFYGLTQVGRAVAAETGTDRKKMVSGRVTGGLEALNALARWADKYAHLHHWDPDRIALGWKGGVGTLKTYNERVAAGEPHDDIERWLDRSRWGTWKYVRKFRAALSIWDAPFPDRASPVTIY